MKKWNDREYNTLEWVIEYISEMSLEERFREDVRRLKDGKLSPYVGCSVSEAEACVAAITYFEEFYAYTLKGYPKGHGAVKDGEERMKNLKSVREALETLIGTKDTARDLSKAKT